MSELIIAEFFNLFYLKIKPGYWTNVEIFLKITLTLVLFSQANEYKLIIQYPKDDTSVLEEALRTTKVIDWNIPMSLLFISEHSYETVKKVIKDKDIGLNRLLSTTFIIEKGSPLFDDVRWIDLLAFVKYVIRYFWYM